MVQIVDNTDIRQRLKKELIMDENNSEEKVEKSKKEQEQNKVFLVDDYHKPIRPLTGTGIVISVLKEYPEGLTIKEIASHMEKIKPDLKVKSFEERAEYVVKKWLIKPMNYAVIENGVVKLIQKSVTQSEVQVRKITKGNASKNITDNYLPTKSECERVIKKISRSTTKTDIDLEELLVELKKDLTEKGKTLKSNWKIITEENLKLWFK